MTPPIISFRLIPLLLLPMTLFAGDYPVHPVPFSEVRLTGGIWLSRQQTNNRVTLPFALDQCESSGRLNSFDLAADTMQRRTAGQADFQHTPGTQYPFDDSDVFKVLEGAAFCLSVEPDAAVETRVDAFIEHIVAAQEPDGYLYTWRTMHPDSPAHDWIGQERWMNDPQLSHELYNMGHLYEAGVAHAGATGKDSLLNVCLENAELLQRDFGDGEPRLAPGHQVIEMGLAKLYRQTGDPRWINLAKFFIDSRGYNNNPYCQDHEPVIDQSAAVGHAVRANYLYSGMADVAALTGDERYKAAVMRIWNDVTARKLHLTGGCGARGAGESYGNAYELPHRCYNETCAAIGFLFWNHRMFLLTGEAKFMDVFERTLYNGFLSGVSLSGDRFFYPNPLEYDGREANNHGHAGRAPWFGCACCPPNVLRTLASLGGYFNATRDDTIFVNLYGDSETRQTVQATPVKLTQETEYPWSGRIRLSVEPDQATEFALALRVPGWVEGRPLPTDLYSYENAEPARWTVTVNNEPANFRHTNGYAVIRRTWSAGDTAELNLAMPVRRVMGHEKIAATRGQVALERGPIVYCLEGIDNGDGVFDFVLAESANIVPVPRPDLLNGITVLQIDGGSRAERDPNGTPVLTAASATAIPYAWWNNRGLSPMTVWLPRNLSGVRLPPAPTIASRAKLSVSFHRGGMDPMRVSDQLAPRNATDGFAPNFDFWPHKGTQEWLKYEFENPTQVEGVRVSWFDDTGAGECRLPSSWSLSALTDEGSWKPVQIRDRYLIRKAEPVEVRIAPVTTRALRLEVQLPEGFSTGVWEWEVIGRDM